MVIEISKAATRNKDWNKSHIKRTLPWLNSTRKKRTRNTKEEKKKRKRKRNSNENKKADTETENLRSVGEPELILKKMRSIR